MNDIVPIVAIAMTGAIVIIALLGGILIGVIKAFRGGSRRDSKLEASEAKLIQELHLGMTRMEERVEVLETLLFDRVERPKASARPQREDR